MTTKTVSILFAILIFYHPPVTSQIIADYKAPFEFYAEVAANQNSVTIFWTMPHGSDHKGVVIYRKDGHEPWSSSEYTSANMIADIDSYSSSGTFTDTNISGDTIYNYKVCASYFANYQESDHIECNPIHVYAVAPVFPPPSGLTADVTSPESISLSWTVNSSVHDEMRIRWREQGQSGWSINTFPGSTAAKDFTAAEEGKTYEFNVCAIFISGLVEGGQGYCSSSVTATTPLKLLPPANLHVSVDNVCSGHPSLDGNYRTRFSWVQRHGPYTVSIRQGSTTLHEETNTFYSAISSTTSHFSFSPDVPHSTNLLYEVCTFMDDDQECRSASFETPVHKPAQPEISEIIPHFFGYKIYWTDETENLGLELTDYRVYISDSPIQLSSECPDSPSVPQSAFSTVSPGDGNEFVYNSPIVSLHNHVGVCATNSAGDACSNSIPIEYLGWTDFIIDRDFPEFVDLSWDDRSSSWRALIELDPPENLIVLEPRLEELQNRSWNRVALARGGTIRYQIEGLRAGQEQKYRLCAGTGREASCSDELVLTVPERP